jgi:hypothetical protein
VEKQVQEQPRTRSPGPSRLQPTESDGVDVDSESDTGMPNLWDPYAGLKPLELDGCALDAGVEMENELPPGGEEEVNAAMVDLMIDLEGSDERDEEWLSPREKTKLMARKKGMISFAPRPKY